MPDLLSSPGYPGKYRATTPHEGDPTHLILPHWNRWAEGHGEENVPPMDLLVVAFKQAWRKYLSPRRKKFNPNLSAVEWSLTEVSRLCMCWAGKRPDHYGAYAEHSNLANWCQRLPNLESPAPVQSDPLEVVGTEEEERAFLGLTPEPKGGKRAKSR